MYSIAIAIILLAEASIFSSTAANPTADIITCYFEKDRPKVADIDLTLCTHFILIGSCKLDDNCQVILPSVEIFDEINKLKRSQNADPKVLFSLTPTNKCMSKVVLSSNMTNQLITKVTEFIEDNSVDGFDIDWEFPVWSSDAKPTDKKGFIEFLKALKEEFDKTERKILITVAVAASYTIVEKAYDVDGLNNYVDYVQIMNYDFHMYSKWQPFTAFNAPLFKKNVEIGIVGRLNSDYSTRFWLSHGLLANKTVFGLPTYGRGFTLMNRLLHFVYAPASGPSEYGDSYEFTTICNLTESSDYTYVYDTESRCPYLYGGNKQWLGFEDATSVFTKALYAKRLGVAGVMIFDLGADDYAGICGKGNYPLIKAARSALQAHEE